MSKDVTHPLKSPSNPPSSTKPTLDDVNIQIEEVKTTLKGNLKSAIKNLDTIKDLEGKSDELDHGMSKFPIKANQLKRKKCWNRYKYKILLGGLILLIIIVITLLLSISISK